MNKNNNILQSPKSSLHHTRFLWLILIAVIAAFVSTAAVNAGNISARLSQKMAAASDTTQIKVWVYFKDKDESAQSYSKAQAALTDRARRRRVHSPIDWYDLPVSSAYVDQIAALGGNDIHPVKWLNAVSVRLNKSRIIQAAQLSFVTKIDPVATLIRKPLPEAPFYEKPLNPLIDYGESSAQIRLIGIDSLHRAGLTGDSVLIAFLDTGFNIDHPSLDSMHIIFTYDFIHDKTTVDDEVNIGQTDHGTATLSVCGGFDDGSLIGPAYKADYLLCKTEILNDEIQVEEDYWARAADTADMLGADIISSSLGYTNWYTYAAMNGHTAVTTIAAQIAALHGILVVVSAGNSGIDAWHYIDAPADADSIIAVGSVDNSKTIASSSSYGPTYDGRIKPDMCAMGVGVYCAAYTGGYTYKSGTSMAAPLIAGGAALVLEADTTLRGNPVALRDRLLKSCDRYTNPDNHYGYGIPNLIVASGLGSPPKPPHAFRYGPNPCRDSLIIRPNDTLLASYKIEVFTIAGELIFQNFVSDNASDYKYIWHCTNQNGKKVASGAYIIRLTADGIEEKVKVFKI
jgi:serine protease AprX